MPAIEGGAHRRLVRLMLTAAASAPGLPRRGGGWPTNAAAGSGENPQPRAPRSERPVIVPIDDDDGAEAGMVVFGAKLGRAGAGGPALLRPR